MDACAVREVSHFQLGTDRGRQATSRVSALDLDILRQDNHARNRFSKEQFPTKTALEGVKGSRLILLCGIG